MNCYSRDDGQPPKKCATYDYEAQICYHRGVMSQQLDTFRGFAQLVGQQAFGRISSASVCVVGLGGVGSWAVEALARCGVGALTLVDLDEVCATNVNRQVQATTRSVGRPKADALAERVLEIHPACRVTAVRRFFSRPTADEILAGGIDLVVDAIDRVENKALLIAECVARNLPLITTGSAGDRLDPSALTVSDLARTIHDPLLQIVRKDLRQQYRFPAGERRRFGIPCVYAPKQRNDAKPSCAAGSGRRSCNDGLGSAVFVTGAAGFLAAAEAIRVLSAERQAELYPWRMKRDLLSGTSSALLGSATLADMSRTAMQNSPQPE